MTIVVHADKVDSYFGYWPEFCDGKITSFSYTAHSSILISISYIDLEKQKSAQIELKFSGVSNVELSDLLSENVLDALQISNERPITVCLEACYGLNGTFQCESVEVLSILPRPIFN